MVQHVLGIDADLQCLAFGNTDRFAHCRIEEPQTGSFHRVQAKSSSFAWKRIPENDDTRPSISDIDNPILPDHAGLTRRERPSQCLERAARRRSGSAEILQAGHSTALGIGYSDEGIRRKVAARLCPLFPNDVTEL